MYIFIKMRHDIPIQSHGNYMMMKKFNYMFEIDILRKFPHKKIGCPEGCFLRVWVSKKTPRRLLAKTMTWMSPLERNSIYISKISETDNAKFNKIKPAADRQYC